MPQQNRLRDQSAKVPSGRFNYEHRCPKLMTAFEALKNSTFPTVRRAHNAADRLREILSDLEIESLLVEVEPHPEGFKLSLYANATPFVSKMFGVLT